MVGNSSATSRRALLGGLTAAPFVAVPCATSTKAAIATLPFASADEGITLRRSKEGRSLSRARYHRAESFFAGVEAGTPHQRHDQLYQVGIVLQLGLSSHLLDVGFDDKWCARNLGLHVARSLAYANATGLAHDSSELERLAAILSPYGKWRDADLRRPLSACRLSHLQIRQLTRDLLNRIHEITGHPRPRGWGRRAL